MKMKKKQQKNPQIFMNKLVYLGLSIFEISKIAMHKFLYNYVKPKYTKKLCYIDTDSFTVHVKRNYQQEKNQNVIGLVKDELGGK